ncbi:MAG: hypothetical protein R2789_19550 [Microthrixaceae bacterium]
MGTSDPAWTEKICAMAMARDGSLQIGFRLGRYPNRNVLDAYAAVSRGAERLTVGAVGASHLTPSAPRSGRSTTRSSNRCRRSASPSRPTRCSRSPSTSSSTRSCLHGRAEPSENQYRVSADLVRYQTGVASGWVELDGERTEVDPETWVSTRDHSWGVRYDVGPPPPDRADEPAFPAGSGS